MRPLPLSSTLHEMQLSEAMKADGIEADTTVYNALISACGQVPKGGVGHVGHGQGGATMPGSTPNIGSGST